MRLDRSFQLDSPRVADAAIHVSRMLPEAYVGVIEQVEMEAGNGADQLKCNTEGQRLSGTITYSYGVSISSAETYPTIAEAISAAAIKMLEMPERLEEIDRSEFAS